MTENRTIAKAKELARELRAKFYEKSYGGHQPISINTEKFGKYIGESYDIKIVQRLSGELGKHLKGLLYRQDERSAVILIAESNNECWRRFVFIKEICHLFLDEREIFTVTIQTTPFFPGRPSRHDLPLHSLIGAGYEQATQQA